MGQILEFIQNHWLLALGGAAVLAFIIFEELKNKVTNLTRLSAQDVVLMLNREDPLLVDLREPHSFAAGHILGAINIRSNEFEQNWDKLSPKNRSIILVAENDSKVGAAATKLRRKDFTKIYLLVGGINAWNEAKLPLNKNQSA